MASCALPLCLLFTIFTLSTVFPANCMRSWGKHTVLLNQLIRRDHALEPQMVKPGVKRESEGAIFLELKKLRHWNQKGQNRALEFDAARVLFLQNILRENGGQGTLVDSLKETRIPLTSGRKLDSLNYVVRIGIGKQEMNVLVDTGSDLTWVQCSPCSNCYQQMDSLYSPSSSYIPIPCNSSSCGSLQISAGCASAAAGTCSYDVSYGDGSSTHGDIATDTLTLGTDTIGDFIFGCGHNNRGLFGGAAGLLGLGRGSPSLTFQAFNRYNGVFSYCLPSSQETTGSLVLGDPSSTSGYNSTAFIYASMIQDPQVPTYYLLNLTGVSVGGVYISAPSSSTLGTASSGRTLIDSGTVITRLGPSLYKAVRDEFVKQAIGLPPASSFSILDTCFNLSGFAAVNIPTLQFHLSSSHGAPGGDVQVTVDSSGILYVVNNDASQACLALASLQSESEYQIIGNYQQQNLRIIYDVKESKVGFAPETCR
ncbi:ASPARTIC PROTEASE IN GUARD CELL 2 protein [Nymphaea thermarum]|nr:ASPARTIC PROTEASE IN GUARD CELL 2 protein [Nymphaea thermarum]